MASNLQGLDTVYVFAHDIATSGHTRPDLALARAKLAAVRRSIGAKAGPSAGRFRLIAAVSDGWREFTISAVDHSVRRHGSRPERRCIQMTATEALEVIDFVLAHGRWPNGVGVSGSWTLPGRGAPTQPTTPDLVIASFADEDDLNRTEALARVVYAERFGDRRPWHPDMPCPADRADSEVIYTEAWQRLQVEKATSWTAS